MRVCNRCVMDESDPDIVFDSQGLCNHCTSYYEEDLPEKPHIDEVMRAVKDSRTGKYDCVMGISGGADSSYLVYLAKKHGLNPLLIHVNNGYDTLEAKRNIAHVVLHSGFDTERIDAPKDEFRDLQLAFLKASVIDFEMVSDHAITAAIYNTAAEHDVKYILSGVNKATEYIMPKSWNYANKNDLTNILDIHSRYGCLELKHYPTLGFFKQSYFRFIKGIRSVAPLNHIKYIKKEAVKILVNEWGWRDYGGKHCESIVTRYYQHHILPTKFNVDKRKAHLSTLICSGQLTRQKALELLRKPIYEAEQLLEDQEYVLDSLKIGNEDLDWLLSQKQRQHSEFKSDKAYSEPFMRIWGHIKPRFQFKAQRGV